MAEFRKKNTPYTSASWLLSEKFLAIFLNVFITLALARHLLPEGFGALNYVTSLVSLISPLLALGLNSIVTRELLQRPKHNHQIMGSALALRALSAIFVCPVAIWVGSVYLAEGQSILFAVLMLASMSNSTQVVEFWLQAHVANRFASIIRLTSLSLFSITRLVAIELNATLEIFVYLAALEMIFLSVLYLLLYHRLSGGLSKLRASGLESKRLLMDSRWLLISGVAAVIYLKVDQVMLGLMIDDRAVGIYAAASRLSEVWYFIPTAIVVSFFPKLIKQREASPASYGLQLQKINDFLLFVGISVALIVTLLSGEMVLLFGEAYLASVSVLVVHIWGGLFVFMRALLSKWLIAENLLKLSMFSQILGALINIVLNITLIPDYGPVGAAYATVISHIVAGYLVLFCHRKLWPMAMVVTKSILLPIRLARKGFGLYKP